MDSSSGRWQNSAAARHATGLGAGPESLGSVLALGSTLLAIEAVAIEASVARVELTSSGDLESPTSLKAARLWENWTWHWT